MEIFRRRNRPAFTVRTKDSDVDSFSHGPLTPEVVEEGNELFDDFMSSRIDIDIPQLRPLVCQRRTPVPMKSMELSNAATRLRQLATSFSQTDERRQVREMAMEISPDITGEELGYLLLSMLSNSDQLEEGIVVVFFFCFDLVIRMIKSNLRPYLDILTMCKGAILTALGPKVQQHGGWTNLIQSATGNTVVMGVLATGFLAVARLGFKTLFNT